MPPVDNTRFLVEASKRRHRDARTRATQAIEAAGRSTNRTTVVGIARSAEVSTSWLYTQSDLVTVIDQLRQRPGSRSPIAQPASTDSLRRRLEASLSRTRTLRHEVTTLTHQLEAAHGELRRLRSLPGK
jgi:hypothetical protein